MGTCISVDDAHTNVNIADKMTIINNKETHVHHITNNSTNINVKNIHGSNVSVITHR